MFEEQYLKLTNSEKDDFARVVNELMLKSFILRENYDRHSKMMKGNKDYSFIERNIDMIREYLSFSGWTLEKDSRLGVVMINNEYQDNHIRLDFLTSLIVYALRYAYENAKEQEQMTSEVYFTVSDLLQIMLDKSLIKPDKRPSSVNLASSFRFLENHNIIQRISGEYRERTMSFYILPSILYVIDLDKINAIFDQIEKYDQDLF